MKDKILYSITEEELQDWANSQIDRELTEEEIKLWEEYTRSSEEYYDSVQNMSRDIIELISTEKYKTMIRKELE